MTTETTQFSLQTITTELQFREHYREVCRLKALGYIDRDICEALSLSQPTVAKILSSPLGMRCLEDLQRARDGEVMDVTERLLGAAPRAAWYLEEVLAGNIEASTALTVKVAESILDRTGHGKVTKNINLGLSGTLSGDEIQDAMRRAQSSGVMSPRRGEDPPGMYPPLDLQQDEALQGVGHDTNKDLCAAGSDEASGAGNEGEQDV